jgi:hypothetical protein
MKRYQHTQVGCLILTVDMLGIFIYAIVLAMAGINIIAIVVLILVTIAGILFSSLTVTISENDLDIRFGPGLIKKIFKLQDIESVRSVSNKWFYGWGIRITPHGWLYNVSGFSAVEIELRTGKTYRIGTDEPEELEEAIRQAI